MNKAIVLITIKFITAPSNKFLNLKEPDAIISSKSILFQFIEKIIYMSALFYSFFYFISAFLNLCTTYTSMTFEITKFAPIYKNSSMCSLDIFY